ncbi:MAG: HEAT repeat domain-containing protein [Spirochaetes bacterium]|nr:HEAT repeat domain-containing protein [Spirochaetota bacterium]
MKCPILYLLIIFSHLLACSSQFKEDAKIQKEIITAVNSYNDDNWEIRFSAVKNISKYSNTVYAKNSILLLIKALDDPYSEVRIEALKSLKKIKAAAAEEKIGDLALTDESSNVRYFAYLALEEYTNISNENIFLQGVNDNDWLVKEAALRGLLRIHDGAIQMKHIDIIIDCIKSKNIAIRLTAIQHLTIKSTLIYDELADIINDQTSGLTILKTALSGIKGYKFDIKTKMRIIELLTHTDKNVRLLSLQALQYEKANLDN